MRGDATFCHDVDFGPQSVWGVQRYFEEQLDFFNRWLPDDATGQPVGRGARADLRHGRRLGPQDRRRASSTTAAAGATSRSGRSPRAVTTPFYLHGDGSPLDPSRRPGRLAAHLHLRPGAPGADDRRHLLLDRRAAGRRPGMEPAWARLLNPVLRLRDLLTPGPVDQKESPAFFGSRASRIRGCRSGPTCSSSRPSRSTEPIEVTGPMTVHLWVSSSAVDTDFTAKLVDVYPPNDDYPEGYDMLLNDSIIRCRYRDGFDREALEPGVPVPVTITLPPTSNLFDVGPPDPGRHLLVELAASRREPEHRRADRDGTPTRSSPSRRSTPTQSVRPTSSCR